MATTRIDFGHGSSFTLSLNANVGHGHRFRITAGGTIHGVRFHHGGSSNSGTTFLGRIRDAAGNQLRTGSLTTNSTTIGDTWFEIPLDSPLVLTPGTEYQVLVAVSNVKFTGDSPSGVEHMHAATNGVITLLSGWINNGTVTTGNTEIQVGLVYEDPNVAPTAPSLIAPKGNVAFDRTATQRFSWTVNDPNASDSQSKYDLRYRLTGAGTWTDVSAVTPSAFRDFAGGTFAAGSYEWQVRTYDAAGLVGPYSGSEFFTAATPPPGPTITAPVNNGTVSTTTAPLTWSYPSQSAYQVRQLDAADAVLFDTGIVSGTQGQQTRTASLTFDTNNVTRKLQVRVQDSGTGLWSPYSTVTVTVSYTAPAVPALVVITASPDISVVVSHPTPTGSQPAVTATEIEVRATTSGDPYRPVGVAVRLSINAVVFTDRAAASGVDYEYRAKAVGANQTATYSAWAGAAAPQAAGQYGGY